MNDYKFPMTALDVLPPKNNNKQDYSKPLSALKLIPVEYPIAEDVCEGCYFNNASESVCTPLGCQFPGNPTDHCSVPNGYGVPVYQNYIFVEKAVQS